MSEQERDRDKREKTFYVQGKKMSHFVVQWPARLRERKSSFPDVLTVQQLPFQAQLPFLAPDPWLPIFPH